MKYEIGKWYKNWRSSDELFAKFSGYSPCNKYFYFSEYVRKQKGYEKYNGSWYNESQLIEASIEEVQEYLPDGHPEKIQNFYLI